MILYGGTLLLAGAMLLGMPSSGWAHGGFGGGHGGGFGGGHGGGFGGGHFGGGFGGGHFGGFGGGHFGGTHFGGHHGGLYRGGYGYGYPHAYRHRYGLYGTYPYLGLYGYYPYSYNYYPYDWSGPAYGSGNYAPYGVETPSDLYGYTSVTPPAASDPSFTPAATTQPDTIAHLTVNVPADARLWIEGTPTTRTGPVRQFGSPPLAPGGRYSYQVRASWDENGHEVTQAQQVEITAGAHVEVKFPVLPKTAGQTSVLKKG
jgi:uncharacterized protein (TIGR03000 family)